MEEINNKKKNKLTNKNLFEILILMLIVIFANNQKISSNLFSLFSVQMDNKIWHELLRGNDSGILKTSIKSLKSSVSAKNDILPLSIVPQINNASYAYICALMTVIVITTSYFLAGIISSIYNKSRKRENLCYHS
ncbi:MAG: hypothetical protein PHP54_02250 [Clostridia bacterium]|nr:hypothetical protein [Clostridia bacterium]